MGSGRAEREAVSRSAAVAWRSISRRALGAREGDIPSASSSASVRHAAIRVRAVAMGAVRVASRLSRSTPM